MAIDTIKSSAVLDGAIATADIADDAVTGAKIENNPTIAGNLTVSGNFTSQGINDDADAVAMTIDSGENVAIGVTSKNSANNGSLTIGHTGMTKVTASANGNADELVLIGANASANVGMSMIGNNANQNIIYFGDEDDADIGGIIYDHNGDYMAFQTNTAEQLRLHSNGVLAASDGIALGVGVNNTASNVLDDYEEGSWTPTIGGSGATYANQQGLYTKVGRNVCAVFDITVNARNSGTTNELHGFPFTTNNGVSPAMGVYSGHISFYSGVNQNLYSMDMYIINGQTYAYFTGHTTASGNIGNSLAVWQNGTRILGTVHYFAN